MRKFALRFAIALLAGGVGASQALTFEAVSVKPAIVPSGMTVSGGIITAMRREDIERYRNTGGPGTNDPGRIHYPLISLKSLLERAYDSYSEIRGPGWLDSTVVAVDATMAAQTTKTVFTEMLRNLIDERFKLKFHVESKEVSGYALVVAKNGPTLTRSAQQEDDVDGPQMAAARRDPNKKGPDGFPLWPEGPTFGFAAIPGQRARILGREKTMATLSGGLATLLRCPVVDATGLTGKYDFSVDYAGGFGTDGPYARMLEADASEPAGLPDIFNALESQLGLKLEKRKIAQKFLIVDQMEKTPAGN